MLFPVSTVLAQTFSKIENSPANPIITKIMQIIVMPVLEALFLFTILMFVWGVVNLIRNGDDPKVRTSGQQHIIWGVVGLFIMISAFAIIKVIANTIGVDDPFL